MDLIRRQDAIDALRTCYDTEAVTYTNGNEHIDYDQALDLLDSLPSVEPENADCIYCHEDSDGYVKPIEKNCHAFIRFGMNGWELDLKANGWHGSAKIRYCPMCGRKLKK